jgi:hypothetical protein
LITHRAGEGSLTDLTEVGYAVLKFGGIRKYLASQSESGMIRADNERLQNDVLKFQNVNSGLDRDLKIAQANLIEQQSRELKHKTAWGIVGILLGALLTFILERIFN